MPTLRQLLPAALATSLFFTSGTAEARFGKHSDSSNSSGGKVHDASPVESSSDDDDDDSSGNSGGSNDSGGANAVSTLLDILVFVADTAARSSSTTSSGQTPMYPHGRQEPVVRSGNQVLFRMGVEGQALREGLSVGLNVGLEGQRWGGDAAATSLKLPTQDGTGREDKIGLYSAHLTYALLTSDRGRLRAEAGVALAKAPDITFLGPSVALSFERCLFGALDVEGRGQFVPVPYIQVDAQAGLALRLGILTLRSGWRWLMLDDRGRVDGVVHRDYFSGPYAGLGLNL